MLSLFRTNQIAFNFFLIVYALLLRMGVFFCPLPDLTLSGKGVLSEGLYSWLGTTGTAAALLATFLVFVQGILINIMIAKFRMGREISLFPGLFYILVASSLPEFLALSPLLIANTFFLLALHELFDTYRKNNYAGSIFNIGFWLAIASLCYSSELIFLFLGFMGLNILRAFRPGELLILLVGFFVPFILFGVYHFWTDNFTYFYQTQFVNNFGALQFKVPNNWDSYLKLGFFAILLIIFLASFGLYTAKKSIQAQKNVSILYWILVFGLFTLLLQKNIELYHLLIIAIPLGIGLAFNFQKLSPPVAETLHLLLLVGILILQYKPLLMN